MLLFIHIISLFFSFIFILGSMFGAGLGLTLSELTASLKTKNLVWRAVAINFFCIPALALFISGYFKLIPCMHAGLFLLALCGGAPFLPKIISIAKGNQTHSITLMVLLMAISVAYIPAILPMVVPGTTIYPLKVVLPQVFLLLLPLFIGLQVNRRWPQFAARAKSIAAKATAVSLVVVAALSLWRDLQIFKAAYGTGLYVFFTLLIGGSISLGYLFGGPNREDKVAMSIGSGARNITAALLVAITNFPDRNVAAVVIIGSLVECVMLVTAAKIFGRAQTS